MISEIIFGEIAVMIYFIRLAMEESKVVYLLALLLAQIALVLPDELIEHIDP